MVEEVDIHLDVVYYSALYPFDYYISKEMKRDDRNEEDGVVAVADADAVLLARLFSFFCCD